MFRTDTLRITPEILAIIARIDEFKGAWRALGTLAPERLTALRRVATIESIGSSTRIEGARLTDREVERLLGNLSIRKFDSRDEQEVAGYAEVMELVYRSWAEIPFNESHVQQLHKVLLKHSRKDERHRGRYKTNTNSVAAFDADGRPLGVVFETATPFDTPRLMRELLHWVHAEREKAYLHPLLVVGIFVVVFLEIHPFQDGNGRLSRALTTLLLLQTGYAYVPYSSLESVIEANKESYLPRLTADAGHHSQRGARMGALAAVLPAFVGRTSAAFREEGRTRADRIGRAARTFDAHTGIRSRARPHHHGRRHPADRWWPQHPEAPLPRSDRTWPPRTTRWWERGVV